MASNFIKIKCRKCKNQQIIFEKPAMDVRCLVCDEIVAKSTGGRANIKTQIIGVVK